MTPFERAAREHAMSRNAKGTRYLYGRDLEAWLEFCEKKRRSPARPTLAIASMFRDELAKTQKPLTIRRTLAALSAMYGEAVEREKPLATWNPFKRLPRPQADAYARTEALSSKEAISLIGAAGADPGKLGKRDLAILWLLYDTGLRRSSISALRQSDRFLRESRTLIYVTVKGGKRREVEVPDDAARALSEWLAILGPHEFVFPSRCGRSLTPSAINKIVNLRARQVGLKGIHPHRFRASYVTSALDAGIPLHDVQASVHHVDPLTTLRYDRGARGLGVSTKVSNHREQKRQSDKTNL